MKKIVFAALAALTLFAVPAASAQTLNDEQVLSNDTAFVQRVRQSMLLSAINISSDGLSTGINIKRHAQVQQVMNSPDSWKALFAAGVATQSAVMNPATATGTVALTPMLCSTPNNATVMFTNGSAVIAYNNNFVAAQTVQFANPTGTLPNGWALGVNYYVVAAGLSGTQFEAAATSGGSAIVAGSAGSGTPVLAQVCTGNADAQQALVSDTIINNTVAAIWNSFFGGQ